MKSGFIFTLLIMIGTHAYADSSDNYFDSTFQDQLSCKVISSNGTLKDLKLVDIASSLTGDFLMSRLTFMRPSNVIQKISHRLFVHDPGTSSDRVVRATLGGRQPNISLTFFNLNGNWMGTLDFSHTSCPQQNCGQSKFECVPTEGERL